jgi:hypothetical protein
MAITSSFANLATVTRASKKTDAGGWDFTNGGAFGALSEYANNVAAIHSTEGLLNEGSSTNEIRNPRCEGAAVGTPGTAPTYWVISAGGTTASIEGAGTVDGYEYVDIKFDGTPTSDPYIRLEDLTQIVAATGEDWTLSATVSLISGDMTNLSGVKFVIVERTGAGVEVQTNSGSDFTPDATAKRFFEPFALSGGGTVGSIEPRIKVEWDGAGDIDATFRIAIPQCENKAHPTSPILPTAASPAAATRAADLITLAAAGSWFSSVAWSAYFSVKPITAGETAKVVGGVGATFNDAVYLDIGATGGTRASTYVRSGGAAVASLTPSGQSDYAVGNTLSVAIGVEANNFAMSLNGATQATDASGAMPVANTRLSLGNGPWSAAATATFCGYIRDFRYIPRRLSDAELEALVGN